MTATAPCPTCATPCKNSARFCANCGQSLSPAQSDTGQQQRILTILFADLVGSTALAAETGLEDYSDNLSQFHDIIQEAITSFGGTVLQAYGDGLLACFGQRRDGEDAAIAGVAAGLSLINRVRTALPRLDVRVGVHSGKVMCRMDQAHQMKPMITGYHVNLTAHLQSLARPGTVVVSGDTRNFMARLADVRYDRDGYAPLKGTDDPVAFAEVSHFAFKARPTRQTAFVEREQELARLTEHDFDHGRSSGFAVIGQAGLGKSTLIERLGSRLGAGTTPLMLAARANLNNTPFFAVSEAIRQTLGVTPTSDLDALTDMLGTRSIALPATDLAILADILRIPDAPIPGIAPQQLTERRVSLLAHLLGLLAAQSGGPVILDDLHWADPQTIAVISSILSVEGAARPMVIVTGRPTPAVLEFVRASQLTPLQLAPLSDLAARRLLSESPGLTMTQQDAIIARSEGNPLFLLSLIDRSIHAGLSASGDGLPETIEATLQSIIESFDGTKTLIQLASVLGRDFRTDHLRLLSGDAGDISYAIDFLVLNGIFKIKDAGYSFSHVLFRDAAYHMLPPRRRRSLHGQLASALQSHDPEFCAIYPELIADHFKQAQDWPAYYLAANAAGARSLRNADFDQAISYLSDAVDIRDKAGQSDSLTAQTLLASAQVQKFGFSHPTVLESYQKLDDQAKSAHGSVQERMFALYGLFAHRMISGDVRTCQTMARRMSMIAAGGDPVLRILWRVNDSAFGLYSGRFGRAVQANADLQSLYDPQHHSALFLDVGADPLASILSGEIHIHAQRGDLNKAQQTMDRALSHIDAIGAILQEPWLRIFGATALFFGGDPDRAEKEVSRGIAIADEQGAGFWSLVGRLVQAVTFAFGDRPAEATAIFDALLPQADAVGLHLNTPLYRSAMAAAAIQQNDLERAALHLRWSTNRIARTGEGKWGAMTWTLRAALQAARGQETAMQASRRIAAAYAERSGATIWSDNAMIAGLIGTGTDPAAARTHKVKA